jgi:oligoribonuclease
MIWVDCETTGLDFDMDHLLEVGLTRTDISGNVESRIEVLVYPDTLDFSTLSPRIQEMHTKSGLLEAVAKEGMPLKKAEELLLAWADFQDRPYMCGSSVHFDRQMLLVNMPTLVERFTYRNFDVSSIRYLIELTDPEAYAQLPVGRGQHRVAPDIEDSIEVYRYARSWAEDAWKYRDLSTS